MPAISASFVYKECFEADKALYWIKLY